MTEEEAKQKWCPMARVHGMESAGNRIDHANCIASDCMAWVWDGGGLSPNKLHDTRYGHCGLVK